MKLLAVDLETTSFDIPNCGISEIGCVLFDTEMNAPVKIINHLVDSEKPMTKECIQYTGITQEMINKYGTPINQAIVEYQDLACRADFIVAHNGIAFDRPILDRHIAEHSSLMDAYLTTAWIDTMIDIEFPANVKSKNLTYLQAFHGFVYPGHRAIFDCMAMLRVLMSYDIDEITMNAMSPLVEIIANTKFEEKHLPKEAGFTWDSERKVWFKRCRERKLPALNFAHTIGVL